MEKITDAVGREKVDHEEPKRSSCMGWAFPFGQAIITACHGHAKEKSLQRFPFTGFTVWRCIVYLSIFKGKKPVKLVAEKSLSFLPLQ